MNAPCLKTRFAPSPTGLLHLGNARTALFSALLGDRFLLRIEDTDLERSTLEFVEALIEDLSWLGLSWDEGPRTAIPDEAWFQSCRSAVYDHYYEALTQAGRVYPCFCSPQSLEMARKRQAQAGQPPRYSGRCDRLTPEDRQALREQGVPETLRFRVPKEGHIDFDDAVRGAQHFKGEDIGDFIIRRADGTAAFFFSNAVDDALMGVTLVVRGEDHLSNTPRQLMLLEALALPAPRYAHTALVYGDDGSPLSKRNGSRSLRELRAAGYLPLAVANALARLGHHVDCEHLLSLDALKLGFRLESIGRSPARFDPMHLDHWQGLAVRALDDEALWAWLWVTTRDKVPAAAKAGFLTLVRSNCLFPGEAENWAVCLFETLDFRGFSERVGTVDFFEAALAAQALHPDHYDDFIQGLKTTTGLKGKALFMPLRMSLTHRHDGPELSLIYHLLPSDVVKARFRAAGGMDC